MKYIDAEKLKAEIDGLESFSCISEEQDGFYSAICRINDIIDSLQQEQPEPSNNLVDVDAVREDFIAEVYRVLDADPTNDRANAIIDAFDSLPTVSQEQPKHMIQWTGNNLKEVVDFTGKSPRFGEWFKSWEEYENYVHTHNDILKLFCDDGSHYEVPVGAWIVKTPDGHNVPSVAKYVQQEQPESPSNLDEAAKEYNRNYTPFEQCDSRDIIRVFKAGAEWLAGQFQKIEGELVDWYETNGVDYCHGINTKESFEVPEGFYIKKK